MANIKRSEQFELMSMKNDIIVDWSKKASLRPSAAALRAVRLCVLYALCAVRLCVLYICVCCTFACTLRLCVLYVCIYVVYLGVLYVCVCYTCVL